MRQKVMGPPCRTAKLTGDRPFWLQTSRPTQKCVVCSRHCVDEGAAYVFVLQSVRFLVGKFDGPNTDVPCFQSPRELTSCVCCRKYNFEALVTIAGSGNPHQSLHCVHEFRVTAHAVPEVQLYAITRGAGRDNSDSIP